jgi:hypothetical protein
METRQYDLGDFNEKRFNRCMTHLSGDILGLSECDITAIYENPDGEQFLKKHIQIGLDPSFTAYSRLGRRGYACKIRIESSSIGIRTVSVDGIISGRSSINRE